MCFCGNAEFVEPIFKLLHKHLHTFRYCTKVVVVKFLPLGWRGPKQGTTGEQQVGTTTDEVGIYQKIFLFCTATGIERSDFRFAHQ